MGLVAEGPSDWLVLEAAIRALHPNAEVERLRPDMTQANQAPYGGGWKGVRAWCKEYGPHLQTLMRGVVGRPLHLLVIHADCSMAHNEGAHRPCPPATDTADALRGVILASWLGLQRSPDFVVLATPAQSSDTWVLAASEPRYVGKVPLECDPRAENELVRRRLLRRKGSEVKKSAVAYFPLPQAMGARLDAVRAACPEADRFCKEIEVSAILVR